jgi:hypothetical protein
MGAGAFPAFTIRRHVLLDTGTIRELGACLLPRMSLFEPMIDFSRTRAESGRVSKNDRSVCDIVVPHGAV